MFNTMIERIQPLPTAQSAQEPTPSYVQSAQPWLGQKNAEEKASQPDRYEMPGRAPSGRVQRSARTAAAVATAPLKLTLTPVVGGIKGLLTGAAMGASNGSCVGAIVVISILESATKRGSDLRGPHQRVFEDTLSAIVGVPLVLVGMAAGAAVGAAYLACKKALDGTCRGAASGYQASWNNLVPEYQKL